MERRTVQKVGGGTLTVSLPKEWAESTGVSAGDTVALSGRLDGVLLVQPEDARDAAPPRVRLGIEAEDTAGVERRLRAAYTAGVEELSVEAEGELADGQHRAVGRVARNLTGLTVAEETDGRVTLRTLLNPGEVSVRQSVRQLSFVALSMHREATGALLEAETAPPAGRDDQADRLFSLVDRQFGRALARLEAIDALGLSRTELFDLWLTARELERVADHAERIGGVAADFGGEVDADTAADLEEVAATARGVVEDAVGVVLGDTPVGVAGDALEARDAVRGTVAELDRRLFESPGTPYRLSRVLDSVGRTAEHGGNVAEHALRMAIRAGDPDVGAGRGPDDEPERSEADGVPGDGA